MLLVTVAAVLALVGFTSWWLWRNQERVLFQPPPLVPRSPDPARRVEFLAADGHQVHGYLVEPRAGSREPRAEGRQPTAESRAPSAVVLAFHGNADLAAFMVPWAHELADRADVTVFAVEYRGYAGIPGRPTYAGAAADAVGALAWVRDSLAPDHVILFGHSLGSAVASEVAAAMGDRPPLALVLQSPFTSAQDMAARLLFPPVSSLWSRMSRIHYDTRRVVAALDAPVWVAHGTQDVVVPVRMGRAVFDAARRRGELLIVPRAGHNDVPDAGGEDYWRWLTRACQRPS